MKAAYFGIDGLRSCLALLEQRGWEIAAVFTIEDDEYDHSAEICRYAQARRIPLHTRRVTPEDIRELLKSWPQVISRCGPVERIALDNAKRTVGENGALVLQFADPTDGGIFQQDDGKRLEELGEIVKNIFGIDD